MPSDSRQQATLQRASELALGYLESLDDSPVCATATLAELRRRLPEQLCREATVFPSIGAH